MRVVGLASGDENPAVQQQRRGVTRAHRGHRARRAEGAGRRVVDLCRRQFLQLDAKASDEQNASVGERGEASPSVGVGHPTGGTKRSRVGIV